MDIPVIHKKVFDNINNRDLDDKDRKMKKELTALKWSRDGRRIAISDSEGFVSIWQADKDLYMPKQADFDQID